MAMMIIFRKVRAELGGLRSSLILPRLRKSRKAEITGTKHKQTSARKPAAQVNGEIAPAMTAGRHKKAYDKASKENNPQAMYDAKKLARADKVDVSNW